MRATAEMTIELDCDTQSTITFARLLAIGDEGFLLRASAMRGLLKGRLDEISLPTGNSTAEMMFRELILTLRGLWQLPYDEVELCHCRAIPLEVVDQAILSGAHTSALVSRLTSASTACGTCRPNVEKLIAYRLNHNPK